MNNGTILLVEDRPDEVELMKQALFQAGIPNPVHVVSDGAEAITYLQDREKTLDRIQRPLPCLILVDIKLPKLSGLDVVSWLKAHARLKRIPAIVVTSSREISDMDKAYSAGVNSYLVKPTSFREFVEKMKITGTYWIHHNMGLEV
ncbi:MAG TPA: response regulator [Planctomycetota bacterium]|nr:response regulator [Planctomycetota bacterium]